jgi:hypothetical protein
MRPAGEQTGTHEVQGREGALPKDSRKNLWRLLAAAVVGAAALFVLVAPLVKIDVTVPLPPARAEPPGMGAKATPSAPTPAASLGIPDEATIARLEARVRLPKGAPPLKNYDRYYAFEQISGRRVLYGMYLAPPDAVRLGRVQRLAAPEQLPNGIDGGGCAEVQVLFDVETSRITRLACNRLTF